MFDWLDWFTWLTEIISGYAWGIPSIVILVGTGIYLTIRLSFVFWKTKKVFSKSIILNILKVIFFPIYWLLTRSMQIKGFKHAVELVMGKHDKIDDPGDVSHFQALSTALSATVGTGNIAGVATAIAYGGPGAIFWMWVTAMVGMATKYTSCTLAVKYRKVNKDGSVSGGPMYTLKNGLNLPVLGWIFALFALIASFGIGNMVQANSVIDGLKTAIPHIDTLSQMINLPLIGEIQLSDFVKFLIGIFLALFVGLVIIGGVKRIAKVASYIVPFMAIMYSGAAIIILIINIKEIPSAFITIFNYSLNPWSLGGGVLGQAVLWGVKRGVFSNESGLGSSPMAHAAAKTNEPVREGLVAMLEPFIDTIIICTTTALVIVIMGAWGDARPDGLEGAALSVYAFKLSLGDVGAWIVGFGLVFFAYSTIIAWSYYGERSAEYIFGERAVLPYRVIYTILVVVGASIPLKLVWNLADIANVLMALPNLISLILLSTVIKKLSDNYFTKK
ncbi:MAG: sodium:alanine symporter family protein [Spirochaetota bacterium]|nr:sodium:alanine symporter family protein [Spirochaetota bacterium]